MGDICSEALLTHLFFPGCVRLVWGLAQIRCSPSDPPEVGTRKRVPKGGGNNWHEMGREGSGRADRLGTRRYKVEEGV